MENKGNLTIENCKFINNHITEDNSLIENKHRLKIINSDFANNKSYKESLIINSSELNIINSNFINNNSKAIGCCINNNGEMTIEKSIFKSNTTENKAGAIHNEYETSLKVIDVKFKYNSADVDGGAIYNYGKLDIEDSIFANNTSEEDGGTINNRTSGEINIINTKFIENESKSNGGVIYNYGNVEINLCEFKNNCAKYRASVIEHAKALDNRKRNNLTISNSKFVKNISNDGKEIVAFDKITLKLINCKFNQH
jgi:predicted outer membrane repeat protein